MRSTLVFSALAALFIASVALAGKPQTATADFTQLAASGITGSADLRVDSNGDARIHEQLSGLTAGVQYVSVIYLNSTTCGSGSVAVQVAQFTANNAGRANFNAVIPPQAVPAVDGGASITVEQAGTQLSCGMIVVQ